MEQPQPTARAGSLHRYLLVLFLNAFVDLGHKITIQNIVFKIESGSTQILLTALVNALILIPFILLVIPAGSLSDRLPKRLVMRHSAAAAIVIALLITLCYYQGWFEWAFFLTLILAMQSAFFSPAKYGYLREQVSTGSLTAANGTVQAVTIIAILTGMFLFSFLFESLYTPAASQSTAEALQQVAPLGWLLTLLAISEWWTSRSLPESRAVSHSEPPPTEQKQSSWQLIRANPVIGYSILGLSLFWGVSQVSIAAFPAFVKSELGVSSTLVIQGVLASAGIGILLGSLLVARLSRNRIEQGLIPVGAVGITLALVAIPHSTSTTLLALLFMLTGLFGGMLIAPLNALIQFNAPNHHLGRILAANNWLQNVTMLTFLAVTMTVALLESERPVEPALLFHAIALLALLATLITLWNMGRPLLLLLLRLLLSLRYRVRVDSVDSLLTEGAVLLVGNHISTMDGLILAVTLPRPVRIVVSERETPPALQKIYRLLGAIFYTADHPQGTQLIRQALQNGETVCLFPEGSTSHNSQLAPFQVEISTLSGPDVMVIPFYLQGMWGSRFSRSEAPSRMRWQRRNLQLAIGAPIQSMTERDIRATIEQLSYHAWHAASDHYPTIPHTFMQQAKRMGLRKMLHDSTRKESFSGLKLLTASLLIARQIRKRDANSRIGVLLPTTAAGVITDLAILISGKCVVNLNYTASNEAIVSAIRLAGINTVITSSQFLQRLTERGRAIQPALSATQILELESIRPEITALERIATAMMAALLPISFLARLNTTETNLDREAAILFSSGSEGNPKGIVLTHRNLIGNIHQIRELLQPRSSGPTPDIVLGSLPLFHSFGFTVTTLMPLISGTPLVTVADPTNNEAVADAIERYHATLYFSSPTFLYWMSRSNKVSATQLSTLRRVIAGSERLKPEIRTAFEEKFGHPIHEGYGATETSPVVSVNIPDCTDDHDKLIQQGNRIGTVGRPISGTLLRIVDPDSLETLSTNEDGLILIAGVQRMPGYLCSEPPCQQPFVELDGITWYRSGDKGHIDEAGFLTIIDRYSRFAKIGGEMVSLSAVEQVILGVVTDDEIEVAAVALPDPRKGERIVLLHTESLDSSALRQKLQSAGIPPLMIPYRTQPIPSIPLLGNGKRSYSELKVLAMKEST